MSLSSDLSLNQDLPDLSVSLLRPVYKPAPACLSRLSSDMSESLSAERDRIQRQVDELEQSLSVTQNELDMLSSETGTCLSFCLSLLYLCLSETLCLSSDDGSDSEDELGQVRTRTC